MENDKKLLEYIDHALQNLSAASEILPSVGVENTDIDCRLIRNALLGNYFDFYIENSFSLEKEERSALRRWFDKICEVINCVNSISWDNQKLQRSIIAIVNDQALLAVKEKLSDAVNQEKEPNK